MTVDERSRHELYRKLEQVLGSTEAATLMEHLPPLGWGGVATKHDIDELRVVTKHEFEQLEDRLTAKFRGELLAQTRMIIFALLGTVITMGGVTIAALQLG